MPETKTIATVDEECVVHLPPVRCRYNLASAGWDRERLIMAFMECANPPCWIARAEAETLADSIIAGTGQNIVIKASEIDDAPVRRRAYDQERVPRA